MPAIKTIGNSGQISLGKEFAGRHVLVDQIEQGVWILKVGTFVPDSERWLDNPDVEADLAEAIAWAEATPAQESDLEGLAGRLDAC